MLPAWFRFPLATRRRLARRSSGRSLPAAVQLLETRQLPSAYSVSATTYEAIDLEPGQSGVTTVLDGILDGQNYVDLGSNTFTFYGTTYTGASSLQVTPHGLIGFGTTSIGGNYTNTGFANEGYSPSQPLIAPLWDDWSTSFTSADMVLARIDGNRLIIEWSQVVHTYGYFSEHVTFQAILQLNTGSQSGNIIFNYVDVEAASANTNGVSATVGLQATAGTASPTLVSYNATHPLVGSGKAIQLNPVLTALTLSHSSIVENQPAGSVIGTFSTTDEDETFNYSLVSGSGSTDNASFTIVDGELRTAVPFNFEAKSSYSIRVRTTDSDGGWFEREFVIAVQDVNEDVSAPVDVNVTADLVAENAANGTLVGVTAYAFDEDSTNNTVTYSLIDDAGGRFAIHSTTGVVTVADGSLLNYEAATSHTITVVATSADGSTSQADFTISLSDEDEFDVATPFDTNGGADAVSENAANGTLVGITAFAADLDGTNNTVTYILIDDAGGRFAIHPTTGVVTVADGSLLNYEAATSHTIRVRATSSDGSMNETDFVISVTDVNEAISQVVDADATANSVAENAANGTLVGVTAYAFDEDSTNNTVTYNLSEDAGGRFTIDSTTGVVTVANGSLLDFESATSHTITVVATSADGSTSQADFTISVGNVSPFIALSNTTILENSPSQTVVGILSGEEFQVSLAGAKFSLVKGEGGEDNRSFTIKGNQLIARKSLNFEAKSSYSVRVQIKTASGDTRVRVFTISVVDVNERPGKPTLSGTTLAENNLAGAEIGILSTVDPDIGDSITWSLVSVNGSNDTSAFSIDENRLLAAEVFDYEATRSYVVVIRATDSDGLSVDRSVTISVTNVNESPTAPTLSQNQVLRSAKKGTAIGQLAAFDDDGSSLKFELIEGQDWFTISGRTLKTKRVFDALTPATLNVVIRVTDRGGLFREESVVVQVVG